MTIFDWTDTMNAAVETKIKTEVIDVEDDDWNQPNRMEDLEQPTLAQRHPVSIPSHFTQTLNTISRVLNQAQTPFSSAATEGAIRSMTHENEMDTERNESSESDHSESNERDQTIDRTDLNETTLSNANPETFATLSEVTHSPRGGLQLRGYTYNVNSRTKDRRYYKCSQYRGIGCLSRLVEHNGRFIIRGLHSHPPNPTGEARSNGATTLPDTNMSFVNTPSIASELMSEHRPDFPLSFLDTAMNETFNLNPFGSLIGSGNRTAPDESANVNHEPSASTSAAGSATNSLALPGGSGMVADTNPNHFGALSLNHNDDPIESDCESPNDNDRRIQNRLSITNHNHNRSLFNGKATHSVESSSRSDRLLNQAWSLNQSYEELAVMIEHAPVRIVIERSEHLRNAISVEIERVDGNLKIKIGSKMQNQ